MTQGALNQTSNPLDVAIEGPGFFQVQRPDGTIAYTRAGQFHLNNQGTIVTTDGDPILPNDHHSLQCHGGHNHAVRHGECDAFRAAESVATRPTATGNVS